MSGEARKRLVALCIAGVATASFMGEHGDGLPHVHGAETDAAATFAATSNLTPSVTGSWHR